MKQKMYVSIEKWEKDSPKPTYLFNRKDPEYDFYIGLGETEVSFEVPPMPSDNELTNRQIDFLRKGREEVVKEFTTKLSNIDDQIAELLALPCLEEVCSHCGHRNVGGAQCCPEWDGTTVSKECG